jgi:hypothetical protein
LHLPTFSSLAVLSHRCKEPEEKAATTRAMAPLICELSNEIDVQLPSLICDPTILKDPEKELMPQFLSPTSRDCRNTSIQIHEDLNNRSSFHNTCEAQCP